jgi:hypothetical protein
MLHVLAAAHLRSARLHVGCVNACAPVFRSALASDRGLPLTVSCDGCDQQRLRSAAVYAAGVGRLARIQRLIFTVFRGLADAAVFRTVAASLRSALCGQLRLSRRCTFPRGCGLCVFAFSRYALIAVAAIAAVFCGAASSAINCGLYVFAVFRSAVFRNFRGCGLHGLSCCRLTTRRAVAAQ